MLKVEQLMDIRSLHREGHSIRQIAKQTGYSRNTVRRVLRGEHDLKRGPGNRTSSLDPHKEYLEKRFLETGLSAVRLLEEIRGMGYTGGIHQVRRHLQPLRQKQKRLTVRFETPPGKQAQADWGYCGQFMTASGKKLKVYVFSLVLCFSRMLYIRFTTSMRLPELIACHQEAFSYFEGITDDILYDNMKQVRISPTQWNEAFLDFANHYGFALKTHRPRRPRTKGKVERTMDYIDESFLRGRVFEDLDDLNAQGLHWMETVANVRIHGTTQRRPVDLFIQDKESMRSLSEVAPYCFIDPVSRKVSWESMVHFQGSRYSVPPQYAGQKVAVCAVNGQVEVRSDDAIIAEHRQAASKGQCIVQEEHMKELWRITMEQHPVPKAPIFQISFGQEVEQVPLQRYEEVSA
jgi:transposase